MSSSKAGLGVVSNLSPEKMELAPAIKHSACSAILISARPALNRTMAAGIIILAVAFVIAIAGRMYYQGKGIAAQLIDESLDQIKIYLEDSNSKLKAILVSTRNDNKAKSLYEKVLGAKEIVVIKDLYSSDEVLMLALQM